MAANYRIVRPMQMSPVATRARTGAPSALRVDRNELMACIAFGLLLAVIVLVFGLLIAIGPAAGGPLR